MTMRDLHERASELFLKLRDMEPGARGAALSQAAAGDEALLAEVNSLLSHDAEMTGATGGRGRQAGPPQTSLPGKIGPYSVIRRIGHGGSGYVLLAEQSEPVHRRVAIKIVPHAAVSPELAARFEFEQRALERTDHPNIARILDAGRTPDGLPYLVMDYVEGVPLVDYCRTHGFGVRDCVLLMLDVADAVQHAHQRGVIHRDLKPANILVSEVSGRPTPRVLDFGIAKPIADAFGAESPATSGLPMGTPAYMAPEQTGGQPIDTRADVYALGAVLYHLVSGRPPIDTTGDILDALKKIKNQVPRPASEVAGDQPTRDTASGAMWTDLDCVLAKALEKEPGRRYSTAAAFGEDLKRLLRSEPIEAHPPTMRYRAARFARRNRTLVASLTVVTLALVLGVVGLTAGLIEARRQRIEAANQGDAQREINRFLTDDLLAAASPEQQGGKVTAEDLLDRASKKIDQRFPDRPVIAAAVHHVLGTAYTELGAFEKAQRHLDRAVSLRRAASGEDSADTVHSEIAAATLLARLEKFPEAEVALKSAVNRARLILGPDDPALYSALNDLGTTYEGLDKGKEAVALLQEALAGRIRLLGPKHPHVLMTTSNLAQGYDRLGQTDKALQLSIDALHIAESLDDPPQLILIGLNNNIGATYQDLNKHREAEPYLLKAAELAGKWLGPENPDTLTLQGNLAGLETKLGDPLKGAALYEEVLKARIKVMGPDSMDTLVARYGYWDSVWHAKKFAEAAEGLKAMAPDIDRALGEKHWLAIQTHALLAHALHDAGRSEEARPEAEMATRKFTALYGADHPRTKNIAALLATLTRSPSGQPRQPTPDPAPASPSQTPGG